MAKNKKPKILSDDLIDKLKRLPDLIYGEDLDTISPANLRAIMEALDDSADYINDYLTDNNLGHTTHCTDVGLDLKQ